MNTPANPQGSPPVHVLLELAQAAADVQHLIILDQIWTGAAESSDAANERDREAILGLGNKVHDQLSIIERHVQNMRQFLHSYSTWVNERLRSDFAGDLFTDSEKETILKILEVEKDNFAQRGAAIADSLMKRLPEERTELMKKIQPLRGNGPIITDISDETACGLLALATMFGVMTCPKTGIGCVFAFVGGAMLIAECT